MPQIKKTIVESADPEFQLYLALKYSFGAVRGAEPPINLPLGLCPKYVPSHGNLD